MNHFLKNWYLSFTIFYLKFTIMVILFKKNVMCFYLGPNLCFFNRFVSSVHQSDTYYITFTTISQKMTIGIDLFMYKFKYYKLSNFSIWTFAAFLLIHQNVFLDLIIILYSRAYVCVLEFNNYQYHWHRHHTLLYYNRISAIECIWS